MAGSRTEKIGTIFKRVQGLLQAKVMKDCEKPLWFEVYRAFPPRDPPVYERPVPEKIIPRIFYPEDIIRAQFYKTYRDSDVNDLSNERVKTTCQRFVDKYFELLKADAKAENLLDATATALKEEGVRLRTVGESMEVAVPPPKPSQLEKVSVASVFGDVKIRKRKGDEDDDDDNGSGL